MLDGHCGDPMQDSVRSQVKSETADPRLGAQTLPDVLILIVGHVVDDPTVAFRCLEGHQRK